MNKDNTKKAYQAPRLTVHGEVTELTQQTSVGNVTDRTFPTGTPLQTVLQNLS